MKFIAPLVVLALLIAGFAYYALFSAPAITPVIQENTVTEVATVTAEDELEVQEEFSGEGSLYSLVARGDRLECAIKYIPNPLEPEIIGSLFTADGKVRGDFVVPTPDQVGQMITSIIIADDTIWQWTDIDGDMFGSQQVADFAPATLVRLVAPVGFSSEVQYDCLSWLQVDQTIFEPPTSIIFSDATHATFESGVIFEEGEF